MCPDRDRTRNPGARGAALTHGAPGRGPMENICGHWKQPERGRGPPQSWPAVLTSEGRQPGRWPAPHGLSVPACKSSSCTVRAAPLPTGRPGLRWRHRTRVPAALGPRQPLPRLCLDTERSHVSLSFPVCVVFHMCAVACGAPCSSAVLGGPAGWTRGSSVPGTDMRTVPSLWPREKCDSGTPRGAMLPSNSGVFPHAE